MTKITSPTYSKTRQNSPFPVAVQGTTSHLPMGGDLTLPGVCCNRRQIVQRLAAAGLGLAMAACASERPEDVPGQGAYPPDLPSRNDLPPGLAQRTLTDPELVARHNNFYEFLPGRGGDVAPHATAFQTAPWSLEVKGACDRPQRFDLDALFGFAHEERIYHFRCVERWAMNVPWIGFPLWRLLGIVQPRPEARWLAFISTHDEASMPGLRATPHYPWPYHEALRLDEAMNDLAFLATGIYGAPLPVQHGAPIRLVVPWKYGYKSAKSIVSIELTDEPPSTFWNSYSPYEYGLLSNVSPYIPHPRWNQYNSFWLRDDPVWPTAEDIFPTALFNGYEPQVGHLYADEPRTRQVPLKPGDVAR